MGGSQGLIGLAALYAVLPAYQGRPRVMGHHHGVLGRHSPPYVRLAGVPRGRGVGR